MKQLPWHLHGRLTYAAARKPTSFRVFLDFANASRIRSYDMACKRPVRVTCITAPAGPHTAQDKALASGYA